MGTYSFTLSETPLVARPSGTLYLPAQNTLVVSDLHLGKAERIARRGGSMLPPYETEDTLVRLDAEITATHPQTVICLGDSFDDLAASYELSQASIDRLSAMMAGRRWIWIEGNHDPGPIQLAGTHLAEFCIGTLTLRHIAQPTQANEISGHYHPKASMNARGRTIARPCFLADQDRVILPAFGTYTGGLRSTSPVLTQLMRQDALAILTGLKTQVIPMPRGRA